MAHRPQPDKLAQAIETFARGFAFTRSIVYPCQAERIEPLWVVRDAPRKRDEYRNEEWIAHGVAPSEMDRIARKHTRGRYAICAIHTTVEPDAPLRAEFKSMRYRLRATEPLMVHAFGRIPRCTSSATIERVITVALAELLSKAEGSRPLSPEHFAAQTLLRQYVALVDGRPVGWGRSIVVGQTTWCSNMFVKREFRRQGIARAILCRILRDDRDAGALTAVLLASHTGAKLYPVVGYEQIGTLLLFTPPRAKGA